MHKALNRGFVAMAFAFVAAPLLAASAYAVTSPNASGSSPPQSVLVNDQKLDANSVLIKYVFLPKDGFVVIYAGDANGKTMGEPLGSIAVKAGDHRDLKVTLNSAPKAGTKLWAALYDDSDGKTTFDKGDKPLWALNKLPLENMFKVE